MASSGGTKSKGYDPGTFGTALISTLHPSSATEICNQYEKDQLRAFGNVIGIEKLPTAGGRMSDCYVLSDVYFLRRAHEGAPPQRIDLVSYDARRHHIYVAKGRFKKWAPPKAPKPPKELSNIEQATLGNVPVHSGCTITERVQPNQTQRAAVLSEPASITSDQPESGEPTATLSSVTNMTAPMCTIGSTVFTDRRLVLETAQSEEQREAQSLMNLAGGISVRTSQDPVSSTQTATASGPGINVDVQVDASGTVRNDIQVVNPALVMAPPRTQAAPPRTTPATASSRIVHNSAKEVAPDDRRRQAAVVTREIGLDTVPLPDDTAPEEVLMDDTFVDVTSCQRASQGITDYPAKTKGLRPDANYVEMFEHFFPMDWVKSDLLPNTNIKMRALGKAEVDYNEFMVWLAVRILIAKYYASSVDEFWKKERSHLDPLPEVWRYMPMVRYKSILKCITLREEPVTAQEQDDKGYFIRTLWPAWNKNMDKAFFPSDKVCIDETMMAWDVPTAYANIHMPRKPKQYGNEWKTIACCETNIIFSVDLVEGKKRPDYLPPLKHNEHLATVAVVLRLCAGIMGSSRRIIMDSGFCVLKVLYYLLVAGLYGMVIIKKKQSWPKGVPGKEIKDHMTDRPLFDVQTLQGTFNYNGERNTGKRFYLLAFKDTIYTGLCAATYGTVHREGNTLYRYTGETGYEMQYPKVYSDYYNNGRAAVDINNNLRSNTLSIEEGIFTRSWEQRTLDFFVDLTITNAAMASKHLYDNEKTIPEYHSLLVDNILETYHDGVQLRGRAVAETECNFRERKKNEGAYNIAKRKFNTVKTASQSMVCTGPDCKLPRGKRRRKTYCACSPWDTVCTQCWFDHRMQKLGHY